MAIFGAVFEMARARGLDVAGNGEEALQLDTTMTETPNEVLAVAASTDVDASMLRPSTTTEYLIVPLLHRQFTAKLEKRLSWAPH